jgi:hypothetical protein
MIIPPYPYELYGNLIDRLLMCIKDSLKSVVQCCPGLDAIPALDGRGQWISLAAVQANPLIFGFF